MRAQGSLGGTVSAMACMERTSTARQKCYRRALVGTWLLRCLLATSASARRGGHRSPSTLRISRLKLCTRSPRVTAGRNQSSRSASRDLWWKCGSCGEGVRVRGRGAMEREEVRGEGRRRRSLVALGSSGNGLRLSRMWLGRVACGRRKSQTSSLASTARTSRTILTIAADGRL